MVYEYLRDISGYEYHAGAFSSPKKLLKAAKGDGRGDITLEKTKTWLASKGIYTHLMHETKRYRYCAL